MAAGHTPKHSLRARLTFVVTVVAMVGIAAASVGTVMLIERALVGSIDDAARSYAQDTAVLVESDRISNPLPGAGAAIAQVVDAEDRVLASTPGGDLLVPIVGGDDLAAVREGRAIDMSGSRLGQPDPYRVLGVPAELDGETHTVIVAVSLAEQRRAARLFRFVTFTLGAVVAIAVGALSWYVTGRTLRPVEELRRSAAEITGTGERRLLPVPAARDELHRLATTLNDMLRRLEDASARQRAFVADAAHELRSPIAALRTELEVAQAHPDAVDMAETTREALHEVERMGRLVDDLLVLARLEEGRFSSTWLVDMRDLAESIAGSLREPRVPVTVEPGPGASVHGSPEALSRLLHNLIANALRHAATKVTVAVSQAGHLVEVRVGNDGPAIPPRHRERIFERFTRLDDARSRDAGGTGLGLAIVRQIARSHGGDVSVADQDQGACFIVRLPSRGRAGTA
ncbi:sensor histidine kinase [Phytoactinopolyspora halotolerans]|uniref:histidine kinase n=1 Tax=Phytoactinopolyspora halotolerans TaxID=1981512 RepID=A0A6L9SJK1_9ACTN|nr:ATP-binding protein [Phytoactinopolyspora halotolerans]NEE04260.1 HAMP domain-containing protein [Phytoactinopolyspora halotolerans]